MAKNLFLSLSCSNMTSQSHKCIYNMGELKRYD